MAIALNKTPLFLSAAALTIALFGNGGASRAGEAIAGEYACESMAGRPCDTHVPLRLQDNGYWGWAKYSGQYRVVGGSVEWVSGNGGPVGWGSAIIGPGTVSFSSGGKPVVWRKH